MSVTLTERKSFPNSLYSTVSIFIDILTLLFKCPKLKCISVYLKMAATDAAYHYTSCKQAEPVSSGLTKALLCSTLCTYTEPVSSAGAQAFRML